MDDKDYQIAELEGKIRDLEAQKEDLTYEYNKPQDKLKDIESAVYDVYKMI